MKITTSKSYQKSSYNHLCTKLCCTKTKLKTFHDYQVDDEAAPELGLAIRNHFQAINMRLGKTGRHSKHRQSLVTLSRRYFLSPGIYSVRASQSIFTERFLFLGIV